MASSENLAFFLPSCGGRRVSKGVRELYGTGLGPSIYQGGGPFMRLGGMKWHEIVVFFGPTSMLQMVISTVFRGRKRMKTGCFRVDVGGLRLEADASMVQRALQKLGYMDGGLNTDLMEAMLVLLGPFQRLFLTYLKRWHLKIHCWKVVLVVLFFFFFFFFFIYFS